MKYHFLCALALSGSVLAETPTTAAPSAEVPLSVQPYLLDHNPPTNREVPASEVNLVEITETFYLISQDSEGNVIRRSTNEAKPGDLIELVIEAENKSDVTVKDVEMINQIPGAPAALMAGSFRFDQLRSLYRISRSGETYFPADAELDPASIRFIQWQILSLEPGERTALSYQFKISP